MKDSKYIEAGMIVNTHGTRGEVKIEVWLDSPQFLKGFKRIFVKERELKIESSRVHKDMLIAKLEGFDDINAVMLLKGKQINILREDAKLPKGKYFVCDILGAEVSDEQGNVIGVLEDAMETPANMIYIVKDTNGTEHLIPAVPEFILETDIEAGKMKVHMIEGM